MWGFKLTSEVLLRGECTSQKKKGRSSFDKKHNKTQQPNIRSAHKLYRRVCVSGCTILQKRFSVRAEAQGALFRALNLEMRARGLALCANK